ncbi:MAG TPA: hypothetical protein DHW02_11445 [Ktedonobacter sp.]|nr:hypothetical protein [Ktedonobacter sp.]
MRHTLYRNVRYVFLPLLFVLLSGCSLFGTDASASPPHPISRHISPHVTGTVDTLVDQVLTNMHQHAWNPQAKIKNKVTGGLFINWQMDNPSITNATKQGRGAATASLHDPQVDLLYLTDLVEYQQLHPGSTTYSDDLSHATSMVLTDFTHYSLPRGWIYFYVLNDGLSLNNQQMVNEAQQIAHNIYKDWYDPTLGYVYQRTHKPGDYDTNNTVQSGTALIDAGQRWNQPNWVSAGEKTIDHVLSVALNAKYNMLYDSMYVGTNGQDTPKGDQAKPSTQAEVATALMNAYQLTNNQHYLNVAGQLLQSLFGTSGLWDSGHGGFYFALTMTSGKVVKNYKETRSQSLALIALHQYDQLSGGTMTQQEQEVSNVLTSSFYQSTYHGFFYRLTSDFRIYTTKANEGIGVENFFTTEAMGSVLDALQQSEMALSAMKK